MGNKNYRKYSEKSENETPEVINNPEGNLEDNQNANPEVINNPEGNLEDNQNANPEITEPKKIGIVTGCMKLNVREEASKEADVLCVIDRNEEVEILESSQITSINNLVDLFVKVRTASGVEGYCVESYIKMK